MWLKEWFQKMVKGIKDVSLKNGKGYKGCIPKTDNKNVVEGRVLQ